MRKKLIDYVAAQFGENHGCHDFDHTRRVTDLALFIGEKEGADLEILEYAALLHDIGRPYEDASRGTVCHAEKGAEIARNILSSRGLEQEKIDHIVHCVHAHRSKNNIHPETLEAKILFDADKLDSLGATGIGRLFMFAQAFGAKLHNDKGIDLAQTKSYTKEDTAYREFILKISKVKDKLFTATAIHMAQERHDIMIKFFEQLNKEIWGENT